MTPATGSDYRAQHIRARTLLHQLTDTADKLDDYEAAAFDLARADVTGIGELEEADENDLCQSLVIAARHARAAQRILRSYERDLTTAMHHEGIEIESAPDARDA
ncbi:hypothetical protein FPZ12_011080 [Amycolatopsis acidicola]|uniref:PE domain-containing protein n=1 Tax=Amycolatopsis acidicola TaxID=2596893 RepID=A0A5N0VD61_9PSEU|nr:hypothetical protein [Amycolatopsis acidicola]KAA9162592.1 hypothetical protein FPZ12_011080 [Amycolatopsis acidicola]